MFNFNSISNESLMFSQSLVSESLRFDESLNPYKDLSVEGLRNFGDDLKKGFNSILLDVMSVHNELRGRINKRISYEVDFFLKIKKELTFNYNFQSYEEMVKTACKVELFIEHALRIRTILLKEREGLEIKKIKEIKEREEKDLFKIKAAQDADEAMVNFINELDNEISLSPNKKKKKINKKKSSHELIDNSSITCCRTLFSPTILDGSYKNPEELAFKKETDDVVQDGTQSVQLENEETTENSNTTAVAIATAGVEDINITPLHNNRLVKFISDIYQRAFSIPEAPRVARWNTKDINQIKGFPDIKKGHTVYQYKNNTNDSILEQRARHFLPGIERLLNTPYKEIYSKKINNASFKFNARLLHGNKVYEGPVTIGIDRNSNTLFHKYFEGRVNAALNERYSSDLEKMNRVEEEWSVPGENFSLDGTNEGELIFSYSTHQLRVFPVQMDLFEEAISSNES